MPAARSARGAGRPAPAAAPVRARFSLAWIGISYFLVLGGLVVAATAYAASGSRSLPVAVVAFTGGAAFGGFFAGRASPHRALLEPALAGALVVGSVIALLEATAFGSLLLVLEGARGGRTALALAGCGFGGGLLGTLAGEMSPSVRPALLPLRFVWISLLVTVGAMAAAIITSGVLVIDAAVQEAIARRLRGGDLGLVLDESRLVLVVAAALATASFAGGLVTQLAAPRRLLVPAASGAPLAVAGALAAIGVWLGALDRLVVPAALVSATAFAVAWVGALLAYVGGRASGRFG